MNKDKIFQISPSDKMRLLVAIEKFNGQKISAVSTPDSDKIKKISIKESK